MNDPNLDFLIKHMPEGSDVSLFVLKGHLLIEWVLDRIVKNHSLHPDYIDEAKLSFYHKVFVARALSPAGAAETDTEWVSVLKFNTLRNDFVHSLESDKRNLKMDAFLNSRGKKVNMDNDVEVIDTVVGEISSIFGFLAVFADREEMRKLSEQLSAT